MPATNLLAQRPAKGASPKGPTPSRRVGALEKRLLGDEKEFGRVNIEELRTSLAQDKALLETTLEQANTVTNQSMIGDASLLPTFEPEVAPPADKEQEVVEEPEESDDGEASAPSVPTASSATRRSLNKAEPPAAGRRPPSRESTSPPVPASRSRSMQQRAISQRRGTVNKNSDDKNTFLTEVKDPAKVGTPVEQWEVKLGHDLEFRMRALEELIGLERTRQLREAILKDKKIDRAAFIEVEKSWVDKHAAEEDGKLDAQHKVFELQTLVQQLRDENFRLDEKLKVVDGTAAEANDKLRRREHDVRQLRAEVDASVIKIRGEEVERLKVIDKVKKKEAEVQRHKETFEKISSQYNRTLEENELLKGKEKELNAKVQDKEQELTRANDEVKRKESELRVMKRNLHLTLPDEYKKMAERIKALEQEKTKLRSQVVELTDKAEEARHLAIERQAELAEEKATVQSKVERLRDLEREATHRRAELTGERKLRGRENRRLLDRNMYYIQKLQTHEDSRVRHSLEQRAVENELAELRKRNMQLLGQILSLDEAKLAAERTARTAVSKSKELQEKLALHNTVHRTELTRVSRLDQPNRPTEDDVAAVFSLARKSHPPRYASQRDNNPNGRASKSPKPVAPQSKAKTPTPADNDGASTGGGGGTLPTPGRPPSGRSEASAGSARSPPPGSTLSSAASMVVDGQETEAADERLATLRQELDAESTARVAAQERVVELAEQLLQKEKESMVADMKHRESKGKDRGGKDKGALRYREVQAQNLSLMARVHDMEVELEQMQFRLVERDEEIRMQRKQTSDLLFKQQVLEEERNKLRDTLDLNGPKEPQGTGN